MAGQLGRAADAERAFWVICGVSLACLVVRLSPLILISYVSDDTGLLKLLSQYEFIIWLSIPTLIILWNYFALSYDEEAPIVVDFADRLGRALHAGQEVIEGRYFPDLDDASELRDLFGLPPNFTVQELNKARRRLAAELHPDRWQDLEARARKARDEALKTLMLHMSGCVPWPAERYEGIAALPITEPEMWEQKWDWETLSRENHLESET